MPATDLPVHCLIESAAGLEAAYAIASTAGVAGISLGESDLRSETGALEAGLDWARGRIVNAAVAAGLSRPPQSVYPHVRDEEGLAPLVRPRPRARPSRPHGDPSRSAAGDRAGLPADRRGGRARPGATIERLGGGGGGDARQAASSSTRRCSAPPGRSVALADCTEQRHIDQGGIHEEPAHQPTPLALAGCAALLLVLLAPSAVGAGAAAAEGSLTEASFQSATLNEAISYNVYLPAGYEGSTKPLSRALPPARTR